MKNLLFLLILALISCDKMHQSQQTTNATMPKIQLVSPLLNSHAIKDSMDFKSFLNLFKSISLPCSTKIINDVPYCTMPFDKNIPYLNLSQDSLILKIKPKNTICEYFDVCSQFPPFSLKKRYSEMERLANKFHGAKLWFKTDKFEVIVCKSRTSDNDIYLLTYTKLGTLLSGIQTELRCINKFAQLKRRTYIDKNLNILITDFHRNGDCDEAGFKVKYLYKINEQGQIYKVNENVTVLSTIDTDEFLNF